MSGNPLDILWTNFCAEGNPALVCCIAEQYLIIYLKTSYSIEVEGPVDGPVFWLIEVNYIDCESISPPKVCIYTNKSW